MLVIYVRAVLASLLRGRVSKGGVVVKGNALERGLERLKEVSARPELALIAGAGEERLRLAACWPLVRATLVEAPEGDPPERIAELLDWIWSAYEVDVDRWAKVARVSPSVARDQGWAFQRTAVVLPDGTLAEYVEKLIRARVFDLFPKTHK